MNYPVTRLFLVLSGAIAVLIGFMILFAPRAFFAVNGIDLGVDPNLMSEIRAPGGVLLAAGVVIICGAIIGSLFHAALLTVAVVFGMYAVSRLISIALDGLPSSSFISALGIELVVGVIAAALIVKHRLTQSGR